MLKKIQVVILPTNEKAPITRNNIQEGLFLNPLKILAVNRVGDCTNQHLYFLSDEEIKEGDWALNPNDPTVILFKATLLEVTILAPFKSIGKKS